MEAAAVDAFVDAINSRDPSRIAVAVTPDFVFEEVAGPGEPSIAALEHELTLIFEAFPDMVFRPVRRSLDGGRTFVEFRAIGEHSGAFLGVPATGTLAIVSGVFNLECFGNAVGRLRLTVDFGGLRRQLLLAARTAAPSQQRGDTAP